MHILRNHFWGSRETPSPLCNIVIIWAYCDHLEGHRPPPYPRLRNMCTTPYHSGYKNDRSALVDIFFTGSKKLRLFGSFAYLYIQDIWIFWIERSHSGKQLLSRIPLTATPGCLAPTELHPEFILSTIYFCASFRL